VTGQTGEQYISYLLEQLDTLKEYKFNALHHCGHCLFWVRGKCTVPIAPCPGVRMWHKGTREDAGQHCAWWKVAPEREHRYASWAAKQWMEESEE
jgi:hypothetical protein